MRVTICDVAKKAGCSIATVSLVLNNKSEKITEKTRLRILDTAKALGYRPNQLAVNLVKQRSLSIGLIVPDISNQFFAKLAKVIEEIGQKHGFNLVLCNTNNDSQIEAERIAVLLDKMVDGLLLCMASKASIEDERRQIRCIEERRVPYCVIDRHYRDVGAYLVSVNHYEGAQLAVQALIEAGHRRIACISGPTNLEDASSRLQGYKDALTAAGLSVEQSLVFPGDYGWQKGFDAAKPLSKAGATAIFASNDLSALGVIAGLRMLGLRVPQDISIVGYDDADYAKMYDLPLTTIHQPLERLGQEAFKLVFEQIKGEAKQKNAIFISPHLVARSSIASPAKQPSKPDPSVATP